MLTETLASDLNHAFDTQHSGTKSVNTPPGASSEPCSATAHFDEPLHKPQLFGWF